MAQSKSKQSSKATVAKSKAKPSKAKVAEMVKAGLEQVVKVFKPVGIAAEVVKQYATTGAAEVFKAIGTEFANVGEMLRYRAAIAAHLFVAESKAKDISSRDYNKQLVEMLGDLVAWRMARNMPDIGYMILRYGLTPDEVRGNIKVMSENASALKESADKAELVAAMSKAKRSKADPAKGKSKGADNKQTVPSAATLCANLQRFMDSHKARLGGVTFAQLSDELDADATANPFGFITSLVLVAVGREAEVQGIIAKQIEAKQAS